MADKTKIYQSLFGGALLRNTVILFGKLLFILKSRKLKTKKPKKILVLRTGGIGDVLMSMPLVESLKKKYPDANITYMVGNWSKGVLENNPNIDKIYSYEDLSIIHLKIKDIKKIIKDTRKEKFDLAFNLEKSWHFGVLMWLFRIKTRIGFNRYGEGFANNINVDFKGEKYELEYYLDLARKIEIEPKEDKMKIYLTKKEKDFGILFLKNMNLDKKKLIGIAPGGADNPAQQAVIKRLSEEKYIELIKTLPEYHFLLFGGKNDIETCQRIDKVTKNSTFLAGKITLKESVSIMDHCKYFVTHDSGPMHMAAATKTKLIALFGPTQKERFAPKNARVIESKTKPCYDIYGHFHSKGKVYMEDVDIKNIIDIIS